MSETPGAPDLPEDIGEVDPEDPAEDIEVLPEREQVGDPDGTDPEPPDPNG